MNEPNAELKQRIVSLAGTREELRVKKRNDLAAQVNDDGNIWLPREKEDDSRVSYEHGNAFVTLDGLFSAKQLRWLAEHIEKNQDPRCVIDF